MNKDTRDACGFSSYDLAIVEISTSTSEFKTTNDNTIPIVAASYRWEGVADRKLDDTRRAILPSNNGWFVDFLGSNRVMGWLDFVSHDFGESDLVAKVLGQMGAIYSTFTVYPD